MEMNVWEIGAGWLQGTPSKKLVAKAATVKHFLWARYDCKTRIWEYVPEFYLPGFRALGYHIRGVKLRAKGSRPILPNGLFPEEEQC